MKRIASSTRAVGAALLSGLLLASCTEPANAPRPDRSPGPAARTSASGSVAFVQSTANGFGARTLSVLLPSTTAGNLIVVGFDYTGTSVESVTDSRGNAYVQAGSEVTSPGGATARLYYAKNIAGGTDTITVSLADSTSSLEVYAAEYTGVDPTSPIDGSTQAAGSSSSVSSGALTTTSDNDVLVAFCVGDTSCNPGTGFTARETLHSNLLEDETTGAGGSYAATATAGSGWAIVAAAFKPLNVAPPPDSVATVTVSPSAASLIVGGTQQFTATTKDANGNVLTDRIVTWSTSDTAVATVDTSGLVTATGAGTATITATSEGKSGSASVSVSANSPPPTPVSFVQAKAKSAAKRTLSVAFGAATTAGDLVVVSFDFAGTVFTSISDSQGNAFTQVGSEVTSPGGAKTRMYYAKNIKGGSETVTVNLAGASSSLEVYVAEYNGADPASPLDGSAQNAGSSPTMSSGTFTTTAPNDMLVAFCVGDNSCSAGSGFTARSTFHSNLLEDATTGAPGSYAATATATAGWGIVAAAFKGQSSGPQPPPVPVASVVVTPANSRVALAYPAALAATLTDANGNVLTGRAITWSSSDPAVATVNATGIVTGVAPGTATITATSEGQSGAATITVPSSAIAGPLHVSAANPRYFADASGRAVLLAGSHTWTNFQDAGPSDPPPVFDFNAYVNFLTSHHHNFTELWRWEQVKFNTETSQIYFYGQTPYLRTGPGTALDGKPKFDLRQFDTAYFDRMRQRVIELGQHGIYVSIMLFDGWSISNKGGLNNAWPGHPYNKANNVNGIDGDTNGDNLGEETQTLVDSAVTVMQDSYVRHVIDAVNDLDNVMYEVSNESTGGSAEVAWEQHIITVVKQYEATKPKQHPVGMTALFPNGNDADLFASTADFISPAAPGNIDDVPAATGAKVIIHDTDHICGSCGGSGPWVWKSFTRGVSPALMDVYDGKYAVLSNPDPNNPVFEETRVNMGHVLAYAARSNLNAMPPHGELASSGYCLANPSAQGGEYLVYLPSGGSVTVDLRGSSGTLTLEWFNPATGTVVSGGTTTGGVQRTFTAPAGSAVLYIH